MSDEITALVEAMKGMGKDHVKVQTAWGSVREIDWQERTCTVRGEMDGVDFFDVLLGLGAVQIRPVIGTKVLIGIIENEEAQAFVIDAEEIEEVNVRVKGKLSISNDEEDLMKLIGDLIEEIRKMKFTTNNGPTIKLINSPAFGNIKTRFNKLLKQDGT